MLRRMDSSSGASRLLAPTVLVFGIVTLAMIQRRIKGVKGDHVTRNSTPATTRSPWHEFSDLCESEKAASSNAKDVVEQSRVDAMDDAGPVTGKKKSKAKKKLSAQSVKTSGEHKSSGVTLQSSSTGGSTTSHSPRGSTSSLQSTPNGSTISKNGSVAQPAKKESTNQFTSRAIPSQISNANQVEESIKESTIRDKSSKSFKDNRVDVLSSKKDGVANYASPTGKERFSLASRLGKEVASSSTKFFPTEDAWMKGNGKSSSITNDDAVDELLDEASCEFTIKPKNSLEFVDESDLKLNSDPNKPRVIQLKKASGLGLKASDSLELLHEANNEHPSVPRETKKRPASSLVPSTVVLASPRSTRVEESNEANNSDMSQGTPRSDARLPSWLRPNSSPHSHSEPSPNSGILMGDTKDFASSTILAGGQRIPRVMASVAASSTNQKDAGKSHFSEENYPRSMGKQRIRPPAPSLPASTPAALTSPLSDFASPQRGVVPGNQATTWRNVPVSPSASSIVSFATSSTGEERARIAQCLKRLLTLFSNGLISKEQRAVIKGAVLDERDVVLKILSDPSAAGDDQFVATGLKNALGLDS